VELCSIRLLRFERVSTLERIVLGIDKKYLVVVVLLAVLAVAFGVFGTVAPPLAEETGPEPQQESSSESSSSAAHFMYPPTFDSGWLDVRNKAGQFFNVTHSLNTAEVFVDITGKKSLSGPSGEHQLNLGTTGLTNEWNRTYGRVGNEIAYSIVRTSDGGYVLAGYTDSYGAGYRDFWLIKTDPAGTLLWSKTYGGAYYDEAYSVVGDTDYALAGYTLTPIHLNDFWLVKTDSSGNVVWNKTYGGRGGDVATSMVQDGGYVLVGYTDSYGAGGNDFYLVKTDLWGNMVWNRTYGGRSEDTASCIIRTSDGGYAIAGKTYSFGAGSWDFWLVKTDSSGNVVWNKTYGGEDSEVASSVVQSSDGGYALAGYTMSYGAGFGDFWLVVTDPNGNAQWNRTYGGTNNEYASSIIQNSDGGYAIAGRTYSFGAGSWDFWLVKTDTVGNMLWNRTYGGTGWDEAYSMVETSDGGYAIAGETSSYGAGNYDFLLVKTGQEIGLAWTGLTNSTITLYRGLTDPYWNYVRVRMWLIKEPTWIYGDINMDGVVDAKDLYILGRNYGKSVSLLSLGGIIGIAGIRTVKKRKQSKQPSYIS